MLFTCGNRLCSQTNERGRGKNVDGYRAAVAVEAAASLLETNAWN
jgi:hypothetical protein